MSWTKVGELKTERFALVERTAAPFVESKNSDLSNRDSQLSTSPFAGIFEDWDFLGIWVLGFAFSAGEGIAERGEFIFAEASLKRRGAQAPPTFRSVAVRLALTLSL